MHSYLARIVGATVALVLGFSLTSYAHASTFSLSPETSTVTQGSTFDVEVMLNTQGTNTTATDATILFDPATLQAVSVSDGSMYPFYTGKSTDNIEGIIKISGIIEPSTTPAYVTGEGVFATITFRATTAGDTTVSFDFVAGSTADGNNVVDGDVPIIINARGDVVSPADLSVLDTLTSVQGASYTIEAEPTSIASPREATPLVSTAPRPECDLCGKCTGSTEDPPNYASCLACLYTDPGPPPAGAKAGVQWTVAGCIDTTVSGSTQQGYRLILGIVGGIAFLAALFGGFLLLTSSGNPDKVRTAKRILTGSITALIITILSTVLFRTIAADLLKIPGIGN